MACHQMTCHLPNDVECGHVSEPPHTTVCQKLAGGCGEKSSHAGEVQDQVGTWCHCHRVGVLIRECNCHQFVVDPHGNPHHCQKCCGGQTCRCGDRYAYCWDVAHAAFITPNAMWALAGRPRPVLGFGCGNEVCLCAVLITSTAVM